MATIEPQEFRGNTFFPGAESVTPFRPGYFFYMVSITFQNGPNDPGGQMSTQGLVAPRDRIQYGQLVGDVLEFVRQTSPGRPGYKVVGFFDVKPNSEYRAVGVQGSDDQRRPELP